MKVKSKALIILLFLLLFVLACIGILVYVFTHNKTTETQNTSISNTPIPVPANLKSLNIEKYNFYYPDYFIPTDNSYDSVKSFESVSFKENKEESINEISLKKMENVDFTEYTNEMCKRIRDNAVDYGARDFITTSEVVENNSDLYSCKYELSQADDFNIHYIHRFFIDKSNASKLYFIEAQFNINDSSSMLQDIKNSVTTFRKS